MNATIALPPIIEAKAEYIELGYAEPHTPDSPARRRWGYVPTITCGHTSVWEGEPIESDTHDGAIEYRKAQMIAESRLTAKLREVFND